MILDIIDPSKWPAVITAEMRLSMVRLALMLADMADPDTKALAGRPLPVQETQKWRKKAAMLREYAEVCLWEMSDDITNDTLPH